MKDLFPAGTKQTVRNNKMSVKQGVTEENAGLEFLPLVCDSSIPFVLPRIVNQRGMSLLPREECENIQYVIKVCASQIKF